jgi:hypothetical protein
MAAGIGLPEGMQRSEQKTLILGLGCFALQCEEQSPIALNYCLSLS